MGSVTVWPTDGQRMLRLGGPFGSADEAQERDRYVVSQTFRVDAAAPVLRLNYDVFSFGSSDKDELRIRVRTFDDAAVRVHDEVIRAPAGECLTCRDLVGGRRATQCDQGHVYPRLVIGEPDCREV